jgi:heme exporter protein A
VKALLTPRENLAWHPSGEGEWDNAAIEAALGRVGLAGYEDLPCHTLSAGQQRRVNLARLYLSHAPLWLLDEPLTAIDRSGVAELEALFAARVDEGGAVVVTSHQPLRVSCELHRLDLRQGVLA